MKTREVMSPITLNMRLHKWRDYKDHYGAIPAVRIFLPPLLLFLILAAIWLILEDEFRAKPSPLGVSCFIAMLVSFIILSHVTVTHWTRYWHRNFIGYDLWIYRMKDSIPTHREIVGQVFPWNHVPGLGKGCAIVIPLGGFGDRRPRVWFGPKAQFINGDHCWRIDDFRPCGSDTVEHSCVAIKSRHNETIQMEISRTLDLFNHFLTHEQMNEPPVYPIGHRLFSDTRRLFEAKQDLEICIGALHATAGAILDTKRFGKSKDAARIRTDILDTLQQVLPPGDSRLSKTEATSSDAA
jgi:hypothetical protein